MYAIRAKSQIVRLSIQELIHNLFHISSAEPQTWKQSIQDQIERELERRVSVCVVCLCECLMGVGG